MILLKSLAETDKAREHRNKALVFEPSERDERHKKDQPTADAEDN